MFYTGAVLHSFITTVYRYTHQTIISIRRYLPSEQTPLRHYLQLKKKKMRRPDKFGNYGAEIKSYVRVIRKASGKVKRTVAALGILRQKPPHLLQPGRNVVTKAWASSVLKSVQLLLRKSNESFCLEYVCNHGRNFECFGTCRLLDLG